jgi:hypothetical protein
MAQNRPTVPGRSRGRWRQQPNKATASQPNAAARSAHSPGEAKNLVRSVKNWRQRCGGMSGGGRRWLRRATPSIQLEGMRGATSGGGSATSGTGCLSNSQNHSPADPNRLYTEGLFCSFERFRMGDVPTAAEQPCRSGRSLKLRHKDRALGEPLLQEVSRHAHRIRTAGHAGFPWTLRGSRPVSDHAALICWQTPPPCLAWVLDPTVRSNLAWLR